MSLMVDDVERMVPSHFTEHSTVGDYLKFANTLLPAGRVIVGIRLDDTVLEGPALSHVRRDPIGRGALKVTSADKKELSLTMLGKLAALIEWLAPQHRDVAELLEQGNTQQGLDRLQEIVSAWQQIQGAYGNLARLAEIQLKELPVHDLNGEAVLDEFCKQLAEMETALQNQDYVLLADILQYEMEGAIANWMALLQATLGLVEPAAV